MLEGPDVGPRLLQRIKRAGVEPCHPATHQLHCELLLREVSLVKAGDLQLPTRRRLYFSGSLDHRVVIEVEACNRITAAGMSWLLFDTQSFAEVIELDHSIALGIAHRISENGAALITSHRRMQLGDQFMTMEEVVAKNKCSGRAVEEISTDQKRLGQSLRCRLNGIGDGHPPGTAITQQALKSTLIMGSGDDQHFTDARQHQGAQRIVDHRLVIDRHQLLADSHGQRSKPGAAAAGKDDALSPHRWIAEMTRFSVISACKD